MGLMGRNGPVEPDSDMRTAASQVRQMYVALMDEGFSEEQTLRLLSTMLSATLGGSGA